MSRKVIIHEDAFRDLDEISAYIGDNASRASLRFLEAAQASFEFIAAMPGVGAPRDYGNPYFSGMRMWRVDNFKKYLIFYLTAGDHVEIVRVLHGARNIQAIFAPVEEE